MTGGGKGEGDADAGAVPGGSGRSDAMHDKPVDESDGQFTSTNESWRTCPKCQRVGKVTCEAWESSCGGFDDYKYTCPACGHVWWIDGIDS